MASIAKVGFPDLMQNVKSYLVILVHILSVESDDKYAMHKCISINCAASQAAIDAHIQFELEGSFHVTDQFRIK